MLQSKNRRSWKGMIVALTLILAVTVIAGCGKKDDKNAAGDNTVVATYEGGEITQQEFDKELANMMLFYPEYEQLLGMDEFREYFVKQQIAYEYLAANAPDESKAEGKKRAEKQLKDMKAQFGEDEYKKLIKEKNLTDADVTDYMARILTVVDSFNKQVTDEDMKAQFEKNKRDMTTASVRHILIGFKDKDGKERTEEDALKRANEVKARLDKGEDFATLAKEYSDDGNASTGGLYEDTPVGKWVTEFKEAALTLPLNTISDPIKTQYGYHIMRVEKRTEKTFEGLTDAEKETLKTLAASEKMNKFMEEDLEKKVIKEIKLPPVEKQEPADKSTTDGTDKSTDKTDKPADEKKPAAEDKK
ncbi:peptidylprolyl isomerase [Paenibacillus marinisediminis]